MYNTLVISVITTIVPLLALIFVLVLLLHKLYVHVRSHFNVTVNCWFCNENTNVKYEARNSWMCPHCDQYNGFSKDGGYNREIKEQLDCSNLSHSSSSSAAEQELLSLPNGFCYTCNEAQRLKVEKLAQFEPKNEAHFDAELKIYKDHLEQQHGLCDTCNRHLKRVLRDKKKMVLGSKFLEYLLRGANIINEPHFANIRQHQKRIWQHRFSICILVCAFINIACFSMRFTAPDLNKEHFNGIFGQYLGEQLYLMSVHAADFLRACRTYVLEISEQGIVLKFRLFCRTVFFMLLYSLGLKWPQVMRVNFSTLILLVSPYALLMLAFGHNALAGFRLTRYTLLVALWGLASSQLISAAVLSQNTLMFIASILTLLLTIKDRSMRRATKLLKDKSQTLQRIYTEDYINDCDEDTLSLLNDKLNSSRLSQCSTSSLKNRTKVSPPTRFAKSPITSSLNSLNNLHRPNISHNTSFHSYLPQSNNNDMNSSFSMHSPYAASVCGFPMQSASVNPVYAAHMEMQRTTRSPFSASTNMLYQPTLIQQQQQQHPSFLQQQQQQRYLLTPSRFTHNTAQPSNYLWSANLYNKETQLPTLQQQPRYTVGNVLYEARGCENMSRSSSHSSGFESQVQDRLLCSRENSCGRDSVMHDVPTCQEPDASLRPLTVNCAPRDSFNFQRIDAHLPTYRRGDLLRKWKDAQVIS